ncbi:MAG: WecB/TagA/CpsF family glycosyltransferase [Ignavibacteriales bacterium]|nr:WecB/TagA/CpsF family glycosyltransferase [Ignavibacteriales bacterium]
MTLKKIKIEILGLKINRINYEDYLNQINTAINENEKLIIMYANANTLNIIQKHNNLKCIYEVADIIQPDGTGLYLASIFLFKENKLPIRFLGSDFFIQYLIPEILKRKWSIFFLGDKDETLSKVKEKYPDMNIVGVKNGFDYKNEEIIDSINSSKPDILLIGLGTPKQEIFIYQNYKNINAKVILPVGDGIKVFAGTKVRGPKFIQKIGLEWLVRTFYSPKKYFKRYFFGNPIFIFRILKQKFSNVISKN